MSKINAFDVSQGFIELASEKDENDLTNLKLQKLLYFAQGIHLAEKGKPLFEDEIQAWNLGPVVSTIYDTFKECGAFPITTFDVKFESKKVPKETQRFIGRIWDEWGKYSADYLVNETHKENSPWQKNFVKGANNVIPKEDLAKYFSQA